MSESADALSETQSPASATSAPFFAVTEALARAIDGAQTDATLSAELGALPSILGSMRDAFRHELCYQDLTPHEEDLATDVIDAFHLAFEKLVLLDAAVEAGDLDVLCGEAPALVAALHAITHGFEQLREAEAARPVLSPIPAVNALLRVVQAVREDRLTFDVIEARLLAIDPIVQEARASIGRPGGDHPLLGPLLDAHCTALAALRACVENEDTDGLEDAAESVRLTAQAIFDAQPARLGETTPIQTLCPKCGAGVGEFDRTCGACGARLPERVGEAPVSRDVGRPEGLPPYAETIVQLAERLHAGEPCLDAFQTEVQALRQRTEAAIATLARVPGAPADAPEHERIARESGHFVMKSGLDAMGEAVASFEAFLASGETWQLDRGVRQMRDAIEQMREMPSVIDRMNAMG